ncbi:ParBc, ParB-like protein nuclease protein [Candidatus Saccharibacteria bacterium RAAC3_TM7_1]|nr:ParBc, ParB-like protein nuclease protein [Candidatus Saccharibacteria bacterium RAAC3_TM7_1]HCZ28675.1 ParB/RepB/Spo0J family partition protein [Candidatus Saccharibacteria bacterium]
MSVKKGLGRSFESLIPSELLDESFDPTANDDQKVSDLRTIKLSEIMPDPDQPRRQFDETALTELAASIKEHGVLQPIVVVTKDGKYQIVAGERRYRASLQAGKTTIPALVRTLSDQHKLELSLIENIQRRDLNPLETATAYAKLRNQFNLTLEEIGARVGGKSMATISNTLRLLRLPEAVKQAVAEGKVSEGQARPLIGTDEAVVQELLPQIIGEGWSARKIETVVAAYKSKNRASTKTSSPQQPLRNDVLSKRFSTKVTVQSSQRGAGKFIIAFSNQEERERIERLLGE